MLLLSALVTLSGCVSDSSWYFYECDSVVGVGGKSGMVEGYVEDRYMYLLVTYPDQTTDVRVGLCRYQYVPDKAALELQVLED